MPIKQSTHKLMRVDYYKVADVYAVPKDWVLENIDIKYRRVYYNGVLQELECHEGEVDMTQPEEILFDDDLELEQFFDCEDEFQ